MKNRSQVLEIASEREFDLVIIGGGWGSGMARRGEQEATERGECDAETAQGCAGHVHERG